MSEFLVQLASAVMAAVGVYVGIRVDLAVLRERASHAMSEAARAHRRIDQMHHNRREGDA